MKIIYVLLMISLIGFTGFAFGDNEQTDNKVLSLLQSEEFKSDRVKLIESGPKVLPTLYLVMDSPEKYESLQIQRAMVVLPEIEGDKESFRPLLERLMLDDDDSIRFRAVVAMGKVGGNENVPTLVSMLYDTNATVRYQAVKSIGYLL